jgi:hypothetical protein
VVAAGTKHDPIRPDPAPGGECGLNRKPGGQGASRIVSGTPAGSTPPRSNSVAIASDAFIPGTVRGAPSAMPEHGRLIRRDPHAHHPAAMLYAPGAVEAQSPILEPYKQFAIALVGRRDCPGSNGYAGAFWSLIEPTPFSVRAMELPKSRRSIWSSNVNSTTASSPAQWGPAPARGLNPPSVQPRDPDRTAATANTLAVGDRNFSCAPRNTTRPRSRPGEGTISRIVASKISSARRFVVVLVA